MSGRLSFYPFNDPRNPLNNIGNTQAEYLSSYLNGLGVQFVVEEVGYFDRDYLSEYSSFYASAAKQRSNTCVRLHFFAVTLDQTIMNLFLQGNSSAISKLQKYYLGFSVIRPLEYTPMGRTVLKWYPENGSTLIRVTAPSRSYKVHLVNVELNVTGLAWQQQDVGVSRCATVAVWTMMQSSAFLDYYSIPTTTEVTRAAHKTASLGDRIFPSDGLTKAQIKEAIKELGLTPHSIEGDIPYRGNYAFSKERFTTYIAPLIRSGYPVLLVGSLGNGLHATCAVGFREAVPSTPVPGQIFMEDNNLEYLYVHDDNIGPSARFKIAEVISPTSGNKVTALQRSSSYASPGASHATYPDFVPLALITAVHEEMRFSLQEAVLLTIRCLQGLRAADNVINGSETFGYSISIKMMKCYDYLGQELERLLNGNSSALLKVRTELFNLAEPMGLHVAVVRIGNGASILMDVIIDCTDSPVNTHIIAHVIYNKSFTNIVDLYDVTFPAPRPIGLNETPSLGVKVEAF